MVHADVVASTMPRKIYTNGVAVIGAIARYGRFYDLRHHRFIIMKEGKNLWMDANEINVYFLKLGSATYPKPS